MDLFGKKRIAALESLLEEITGSHIAIRDALAEYIKSVEIKLDELKKDKNRQAGEIAWIQTRLDRLDKPQND